MRSRSVCLALVAALTVALWSGTAHADLDNPVHNGVKGCIGMGLVGLDLTLIIEGAARVRNPWLLSLLPLAVAGGGAAGGWYMGRASAPASIAALVSGLALIIPAALLVVHGRSYRRSGGEDEGFIDRTEEGMPLDDEDEFGAVPDSETRTQVVAPEDAPEEAPMDDDGGDAPEEDEGPGPNAGLTTTSDITVVARVDLPVGGMLRVFADQLAHGPSLTLELAHF